VSCLLTSEKEWHEVDTGKLSLARLADDKLRLQAELGGEFPAVRSYSAKAHGYGLATNLPVLLVKLQHRGNAYRYAQLQDLVLKQIDLTVTVSGLRTLAVSNDFGPVDSSKPFQPFGASPVAGNALIVGSREAFQRRSPGRHSSFTSRLSDTPRSIRIPMARFICCHALTSSTITKRS
jgi:hypothetical protein